MLFNSQEGKTHSKDDGCGDPDHNEVQWFCIFHPTNWRHEIGCPHIEWTKEDLLSALIRKKIFEEKKSSSCVTGFRVKKNAT